MGEIDKPYRSDLPHQAKEWEDPSLRWEEMEAGIFAKILAEDPTFFDRRKKRRLFFWFSFGVILLLVGAFSGWFFLSHNGETKSSDVDRSYPGIQNEVAPVAAQPVPSPNGQPTVFHLPIASDTDIIEVETKPADQKTDELPTLGEPGIAEEPTQAGNRAAIPAIRVTLPLGRPIPPVASGATNHLQLEIMPVAVPQAKAERKPLRASIAAYGGGVLSNGRYQGSSTAADLRNSFTSSLFGYEGGLEWRLPVMRRSDIALGIGYQAVFQNIDSYTERQVPVEQPNTITHVTYFRVGGRTSYEYGDTSLTGTEKNRLVQYNSRHKLLLSAAWGRQISWRSWALRASLGVVGQNNLRSEGRTLAADGAVMSYESTSPILRSWQLQSNVGFQISRSLGSSFAIELKYQWRRQWTNSSLEDGLIWRPNFHFLGAGVSIRL